MNSSEITQKIQNLTRNSSEADFDEILTAIKALRNSSNDIYRQQKLDGAYRNIAAAWSNIQAGDLRFSVIEENMLTAVERIEDTETL